jgi:hypothetical protein
LHVRKREWEFSFKEIALDDELNGYYYFHMLVVSPSLSRSGSAQSASRVCVLFCAARQKKECGGMLIISSSSIRSVA